MYYVIFTGSGQEEKIQKMIAGMIPDSLYEECFIPKRVRRKKFRGRWETIREKLTLGYLFISTDHIKDIYRMVKGIPAMLYILGKNTDLIKKDPETDELFYQLSQNEEDWLMKMTGRFGKDAGSVKDGGRKTGDGAASEEPGKQGDYTVELSQVSFDENDQVVIVSGPLKGMEGHVKKINLHKRVAEVEVEFMGRKTDFYLGIEIVERL